MRTQFVSLTPGQPDPVLIHRLVLVQQVCLVLAVQVAAATLAVGLIQPLDRVFPIVPSRQSTLLALAALLSAFSLFLSDEVQSRAHVHISRLFAILTGLISAVFLGAEVFHRTSRLGSLAHPGIDGLLGESIFIWQAIGFGLLAVVIILSPSRKLFVRHVADVLSWGLCLVTLSALSQCIFFAMHLSGIPLADRASVATLASLVPLTVVVALRQAGHGVFSIFLGHGMGGKIARLIAPAIIGMHFLREFVLASLIGVHLLPAIPVMSLLTSLGTCFMFVLLLFLVWRINRMEQKVHDLTLRDELTRLYNLRGFNLLADQSLRMANRAGMPFSVLYVDLDNLKLINDELGHNTGSDALVETARLLQATFRETDVIGRVGGDEFAVAGQFSQEASSRAVKRLQQAAALHNSREDKRFPLSFSVGLVTSDESPHAPLHALVKKADDAMYHNKRTRKIESEAAPAADSLGPKAAIGPSERMPEPPRVSDAAPHY